MCGWSRRRRDRRGAEWSTVLAGARSSNELLSWLRLRRRLLGSTCCGKRRLLVRLLLRRVLVALLRLLRRGLLLLLLLGRELREACRDSWGGCRSAPKPLLRHLGLSS